MDASNKLCTELLCEYKDFEKVNLDVFIGYKLVEKKNLNYYSIVSGLFRYRPKRITENSYHGLYEKEKAHYNEHLVNRLSIFVNPEDAYNALCEYKNISEGKCELVILKITISGELEKAKYSNKYVDDVDVVIGHTIEKISEVPFKHS